MVLPVGGLGKEGWSCAEVPQRRVQLWVPSVAPDVVVLNVEPLVAGGGPEKAPSRRRVVVEKDLSAVGKRVDLTASQHVSDYAENGCTTCLRNGFRVEEDGMFRYRGNNGRVASAPQHIR